MNVADIVQQHLGPAEIQQIANQLGVDQATAQSAVQAALPNMLAGMAGNAQESGGANAIEGLLGSHAGILGNLGSILGGGGAADGGGILGSVLGHHSPAVGQEVQQRTGLDSAKVGQLLAMLAPIVLAALAHRRQQSASAGTASAGAAPAQPDLGSVLRQDATEAQKNDRGPGGLLGKILSHVETRP